MTLILTELSQLGIIMVVENAITLCCYQPTGTFRDRSFKGLKKNFEIPKINAGLSFWGWATVAPFDDIKEGQLFDWWLENFLYIHRDDYHSISELAEILEAELRTVIPPLTDEELAENPNGSGGIHLAGYILYEGNYVPSFWHIHNGYSQVLGQEGGDPHTVNANHDCPPARTIELINEKKVYLTTNGEIEVFNGLFSILNEFIIDKFSTAGYLTPMPVIRARADFYKAQIKFLSNLYHVSGEVIEYGKRLAVLDFPESISDEVTLLLIEENRITHQSTS